MIPRVLKFSCYRVKVPTWVLSITRSLKLVRLAPGMALLACGCATAWKEDPTFYRTEQTRLSVASTPPGKLYLDNKFVGVTPLLTYLDCEQEINRRRRNVSYWQTEPGYSTLFTLLSLGVYLPFSAIPADTETSIEPTGTYKDETFRLRIEAKGYAPWKETIRCTGQKAISFALGSVVNSGRHNF